MTLLILAAGMGSRYGGLKQIDPISECGEFIVDFSVYDAILAGFDKVVFIIKEENYQIFRDTIGKRIENKIMVEYVFQSLDSNIMDLKIPKDRVKPWGTAHAVMCARDAVKDSFVVINSDDFYGRDSYKQAADFLNKNIGKNSLKPVYCMPGYILGNTLTDNGHVARGICEVNKDGFLTDITERTKIIKTDDLYGAAYEEINGKTETWVPVSRDSLVSMNFWGFTPDVFDKLEKYFAEFVNEISSDPLKCEFYLPMAVKRMIGDRLCDVSVIKTTSKWYGVTYHEDKPLVTAQIKRMIDDGLYPNGLWK